jgi:hypothetical protein
VCADEELKEVEEVEAVKEKDRNCGVVKVRDTSTETDGRGFDSHRQRELA